MKILNRNQVQVLPGVTVIGGANSRDLTAFHRGHSWNSLDTPDEILIKRVSADFDIGG